MLALYDSVIYMYTKIQSIIIMFSTFTIFILSWDNYHAGPYLTHLLIGPPLLISDLSIPLVITYGNRALVILCMFELYFLSHVIQIFTGEKHVSEERNKGKLQHKHLCRHLYNSAFDVLMFANHGKFRMPLVWFVC